MSSIGPPNKDFFKYYKTITIDHSLVSGTGSLKNFPVLISLLDSDLHDEVQSTGYDIAFANDTAWLDHEIELFERDYSPTKAKLVAWVRIPSLSTSLDTVIYLYYGNASMNSRENPEGVWGNTYKGVWHLSESPSDPSPQFEDGTSNNNDGTAYGAMTSADQVSGRIDGSIDFDGSDDYINLGSSISIASSSFSVSIWAKRGSSSTADIIFQQGPAGQNTGFHAGFRSNGFFTFAFWADDLDTTQSYNDTDWHHWVCTYDASTKARKIYRDGVNIASNNASNHFLGSGTFYLGYDGMVNEGFDGQLDESRILNIALSSEWINTSYINQNDPESFYLVTKEMEVSAPPNAHYFKYFKEIIIDHSMVSGSNDLLNFPVLISCFDEDLHDDAQSNGNDIAFANDTAWLDHEIELFQQDYSSTHAQLIAWVRVPRLSPSFDTVIRMYYGNSTISSQENPSGVWDSNYKGVWHLSEDPSGMIYDSTSYNNDGTVNGSMTSNDLIKGKIGLCLDFDSNDDYINCTDDSSLNMGDGDFTFGMWFNTSEVVNPTPLGGKGQSGSGGKRYGIVMGPNFECAPGEIKGEIDDDSSKEYVKSSVRYDDSNWHYVLLVRDGTNLKLYLDGLTETVVEPIGTYGNIDMACPFFIGRLNSSSYYFGGQIDEVRVSDTVRSADWLATEYNNQNDPINFYSIGKEYTVSGNPPKEHFFKYYKELTIDHTMVSGSNYLINFPLLISLFDEDLYNKTQENGDDIAFAYKGAWLDHEIELFKQTYNETHAQLIAWVSIPRLSPSFDTVIRMYYGNATMSSRENPEGLWNTNYKGVWHLSEDPADSSPAFKDSTPNNNDGTDYGSMTSGDQVIGQIDGSLDFDGGDDYLEANDSSSLTIPGSFTVSAWINTNDLPPDGDLRSVVGKGMSSDNPGENHNYGIMLENAILTTGQAIEVYYEPSTGFGDAVAASWVTSLSLGQWYHVVGVHDAGADTLTLFVNGVQRAQNTGATATPDTGNAPLRIADVNVDIFPNEFNGQIDEVRVSDTVHSADWIKTEYNNQYNPQAFLMIGSEKKLDKTPPTYSNLEESSDPLELGEIEVITINISDPSGINQVKIEFEGVNNSMVNIIGDTWQYDSWIPSSVGNYTYTIWMEDTCNNWNSTMGTIEVLDRTPPTYSNLIESADPLQLGQNETIEIQVFDLSGVNQTLLEYDSTNHSMIQDGNKWSWSKWKPAEGFHLYKIYMQDNQDNWNMTSGGITVITSYAPFIEPPTESEDPLELGNDLIITVDVYDVETNVSTVLIELDGINRTMSNISLYIYEYIWNASEYIERGYFVGLPRIVNYKIYANDTDNNWNSHQASFQIKDETPPAFSALFESDDPLEYGNKETLTINCTDLAGISEVTIEIGVSNPPMVNLGGDQWQYNWTPSSVGNHSYTIWAKDGNNNWNFTIDSILVQDTTPPMYSDLTEKPKIVELGDLLTISINATDLADIKDVSIEYENDTYLMTNKYMTNTWEYSSWMPNSIGNYTYTIYITDNNDNLNYVSSSILFQDTILPYYTNLYENADPLELGDNQIIRIDLYDFAGINRTLIEFEGANHSMTNIYMTNTWQYNLWTPNNWTFYEYTIHIRDNSGNWNHLIGNFTVQDTTPPPSPRLTYGPSGDVSGKLVFNWDPGSDPSGIAYYILIIDNETNPLTTPGYLYILNITNVGPDSSYFELHEILPPGTYHFFLAQVDGVGHQSDYTVGTFTVITSTPENNTFLIIVIILASAIISVTAIVLVRRKLNKRIAPSREKIPFKIISSHLNKLLSAELALKAEKIQIVPDEKKIEIRINEIKSLGEELFAEGAYLEAQEQFKMGRDLLINLGREEDAKLLSDLISGIKGLIEERERRFEILEKVKNEGDSVKIFELYYDIIEISKKLRDLDGINMYESELIQFFQINKFKLIIIQKHIYELEQEADSLIKNNLFEKAAHVYEKCENFSNFLVQLGNEEEINNIRKFKIKKEECLKKILDK